MTEATSSYLNDTPRNVERVALEIAVKALHGITGGQILEHQICSCSKCRALRAIANIEAMVPEAKEWRP